MATTNTALNRLNYKGDTKDLIRRICLSFGIGELKSYSVIEMGYEDCNIVVETNLGKYVAKIFSKARKPEEITRYIEIIKQVITGEVSHPKYYKTTANTHDYRDAEAPSIQAVLMDFIDGQSFLSLDKSPNSKELEDIMVQAALINGLDYRPPYLFDSWAIPNIESMFERTEKFVSANDQILISKVIKKYKQIPVAELPHCFVHGDFTKANIIKSTDGKIYVIDFSVAGWYPRIQELAVIASNLMYDHKTPLLERVEIVKTEYNKLRNLTDLEENFLYDYALAGTAMEFLGSHQEKFLKGNDSEETNYWLSLGRQSLKQAIE